MSPHARVLCVCTHPWKGAPMSRLFVAFLALAFSSVLAAAATDDELKQQIVGKWSQQASCGGDVLTFNADGTVVHHRQGAAAADDESGTYQIVGGMLKGTLGP